MSTHGKFNSGLWQCEACGAWLDPSDAVPGSWRWTGAAWEHGGHANMPPQAGHFPARFFASIADAIAHATATLTAERDALRAIIEGRDTPPTDAEIAAHHAVGGSWRCLSPEWDGTMTSDCDTARDLGAEGWAHAARTVPMHGMTRWWALDAAGRPCTWPVVDGVSR